MTLNPVEILREIASPEYNKRRIFIAKLRIAIFIGFWILYLLILKGQLSETKPVTIIILICSFATVVCYFNYFKNILLLPTVIVQILADLISLTAVVYLTGGGESEYFIVYIFYVLAAGLFYNYRLAFFLSTLSVIFYGALLFFSHINFTPPLQITFEGIKIRGIDLPYIRPLFLIIFVAVAVYATKIAHHFTQSRERELEERNKELLALQQMSSTIRTFRSLDGVLTQVVNGVLEGLDFKICLLILYDKTEGKVRCIAPDVDGVVEAVEKEIGLKFNQLYIPIKSIEENEAFKQLEEGRIIFRRSINEMITDIEPNVPRETIDKIQHKLKVQRVVAIPLVTSREVVGVLIGLSSDPFVEEQKVSTFQAFADQASLTVEAAILISELKRKNIALIEAVRFKSEFLTTMSHELRTPLTAIIGFSELLIENVMGVLSEEQEDSIKEVLTNANNLLEMINNLLDLAKSDSGKMELNRRHFDWDEMLRGIERSLVPLIKKKRQQFSIQILAEQQELYADEKRMKQVLLNILSNAIKFTPKEGKINVRTEVFAKLDRLSKKYKVDAKSKQNKEIFKQGGLVCIVEDTGIGIEPEYISSIFDVFRQVDISETRSYDGSGLGLALVKQFIEMHGGYVWVESKVGVGTKFTFTVPLQ